MWYCLYAEEKGFIMNILLIGNGFDLAHGLPTAYTDFLGFCKMIREVYKVDKSDNADKIWEEMGIKLKSQINMKRLKTEFLELYSIRDIEEKEDRGRIIRTNTIYDELYDDIENNSWIDYFFQNNRYIKENWIDFESEISKKIQELDNCMQKEDKLSSIRCVPFFSDYFLEIEEKQKQERNRNKLEEQFQDWFEGINECPKKMEKNREEYYCEDCKELESYENMIFRLEEDLNKLIRALEIYLTEYVGKIESDNISPDIEELVILRDKDENGIEGNIISKVLSFNYSNTYERLYLIKQTRLVDKYIDYIHGKADINNKIETNNMVLGIDEYLSKKKKNKKTDFIAFKKYYQRIYKATGSEYKNWVDEIEKINAMYVENINSCKDELRENKGMGYDGFDSKERLKNLKMNPPKHNLYIFGHSLDITDRDVLKDLILKDNVYTTIFYPYKEELGKKIANLVKIIGQEELIRRTGGSTKTIEFKQQQDMVERK